MENLFKKHKHVIDTYVPFGFFGTQKVIGSIEHDRIQLHTLSKLQKGLP